MHLRAHKVCITLELFFFSEVATTLRWRITCCAIEPGPRPLEPFDLSRRLKYRGEANRADCDRQKEDPCANGSMWRRQLYLSRRSVLSHRRKHFLWTRALRRQRTCSKANSFSAAVTIASIRTDGTVPDSTGAAMLGAADLAGAVAAAGTAGIIADRRICMVAPVLARTSAADPVRVLIWVADIAVLVPRRVGGRAADAHIRAHTAADVAAVVADIATKHHPCTRHQSVIGSPDHSGLLVFRVAGCACCISREHHHLDAWKCRVDGPGQRLA